MRYSVRKSGTLITRGHPRPTVEDALGLTNEMLAEVKPSETVTPQGHDTGHSYKNEEIAGLRNAVEAQRET
jgi:hypothetical protein